jgi:hypothetical protein
MRRSNSALKSRRRQRLSVDVMEDRQLLATITVNTTVDEAAADSEPNGPLLEPLCPRIDSLQH